MHRVLKAAAILAGCVFASTALAERQRIDPSIQYRDSSIANAHGRSGNATIEARALRDKNGETLLDVTTNGTFAKVQVKIPTSAGEAETVNYTGVGSGAFSATIDGLARWQPIEVHATVTGVDANRTDVVSATETVKLRPDLAVGPISVPPHAAVGMPVRVTALVSEKNGDVGARTDCVLYAGTTELSRAANIWVDAGGAVTCSFAPIFASAGAQQLRVAVEKTSPADWDTANDSGSAQTQVYSAGQPFPSWNTWAREHSGTTEYQVTSRYYSNYRKSHETRQMSTMSAYFTGPMNVESLRVTAAVSTDGELLYDGDEIEADYYRLDPEFWGDVAVIELYGDGFDGIMWSYGTGANQSVSFDLRRIGGTVTYHTYGFEYDRWRGTYYTWNETGTLNHGTIARPYGSTVSMTAALSDGANMWVQNDSHMPMNPFEEKYSWSFCDDGWSGTVCESVSVDVTGKWGFDFPPHN